MLAEYALWGLLAVLAFLGMLALSVRSERARRAREATMTPEQHEVERREKAAFSRIGLGGGEGGGRPL
jgi:cytochrome c-type biogenesis protein CcmH/NrfF